MAMDGLTILTKTYDMIKYGYGAIAQFPKSEKYALGTDIKQCMHSILRLIISAVKKFHKSTTLQNLDIEIAVLRHFIRLAYEQGFLPPKKYEVWTEKVVEIGRMTGGWIKQAAR